jgi:hypothetical protein
MAETDEKRSICCDNNWELLISELIDYVYGRGDLAYSTKISKSGRLEAPSSQKRGFYWIIFPWQAIH